MSQKSREWNGKSRGGFIGNWIFIQLIRFFGLRSAYFLLSLIVFYFIPFAPKATRAVWYYNRRILKYGRIRSIYALYMHYFSFGRTLIDKIAIKNGLDAKFTFEFENLESSELAIASDSCFLIGAHVGAWEVGSVFFRKYADRINVLMLDAEHTRIKELVKDKAFSHKVIPIEENNLSSIMNIKKAVDARECICFQGDRFLGSQNSFRAEFMGKEADFPKGPFLLAEKFKVPVILYFAMRDGAFKYRFYFKKLDAGLTWEEISKEYLSELEARLKKYPQQWFNFYNLWEQ